MSRLKPQFVTFSSSSSSSTGQSKDTDQKSKHGNDRWKEDKSEPLIKLGLGIGGSSFCNTGSSEHRRKNNSFNRTLMVDNKEEEDDHHQLVEKEGCRKCSVVRFTEEQLEELNIQLLIFKYLVWGIPVPFQLLIPLWRKFSCSSVPQHTQSSPICMICTRIETCKNSTESEPRCKRTDGKKWRCKKGVVPYQKYCKQHINRGKVKSSYLGSSASRESRSAHGSTSATKSFETEVKEQMKVGLDTSLKISLTATPAEDNGSSFSSEATESDDENTAVWEIIALSS